MLVVGLARAWYLACLWRPTCWQVKRVYFQERNILVFRFSQKVASPVFETIVFNNTCQRGKQDQPQLTESEAATSTCSSSEGVLNHQRVRMHGSRTDTAAEHTAEHCPTMQRGLTDAQAHARTIRAEEIE
eukprot:2087191-Rhodomonas_salina.2